LDLYKGGDNSFSIENGAMIVEIMTSSFVDCIVPGRADNRAYFREAVLLGFKSCIKRLKQSMTTKEPLIQGCSIIREKLSASIGHAVYLWADQVGSFASVN
jgi:hypothetical protein